MARSSIALGVEVVGEDARLALVERSEQGLTLHSTQTVPASDLARALRALPRRPSAVACALSLEQAAVRILSLPPTTDENLERVIGLEAEAAMPLTSEDLALSHHVLGMTEQSRLEVLVASARHSAVQNTLRRVNSAPWVSATVTVSSIALLNALQRLRSPGGEQVTAILRVEDREAELVVLDRSRIVNTLYIPIHGSGGSEEPRAGGEGGVPVAVGAGGRESASAAAVIAPVLPWIASLSQQIRYALQALSYERGISVERLYLCGKGATRGDAVWQLGERLEIPLTVLGPRGAGSEEGAEYTVAYGCAIQAAGEAAIPLNLTPAKVTQAREVEQRRQAGRSWAALGGAIVVASLLVFGAAVHNLQSQVKSVNAKLAELGGVVAAPASAPQGLDKKVKALEAALDTPVSAAKALSALSRHLPHGTWLADLSYNAGSNFLIRGYSTDQNGAQEAQRALLRQQLFEQVSLDYRSEEVQAGVPVWGFQLTCKLGQGAGGADRRERRR